MSAGAGWGFRVSDGPMSESQILRLKEARMRLTLASGWVQALARLASLPEEDLDAELPALSARAFARTIAALRGKGIGVSAGVLHMPGASLSLMREACHLLHENTRKTDHIARLAPDALGLIFPHTSQTGCHAALFRLANLLKGILPADVEDLHALNALQAYPLPEQCDDVLPFLRHELGLNTAV